MKLYTPRLMLLALAVGALFNPAPARADNEPMPSNRNPGTVEPASNWKRVVAVRNTGSVGADKPFFGMAYWCHVTDCDLQQQGTGKNRAQFAYGGGEYRNGIPVYTLIPAANPLAGNTPYYRAVPAPWGVEVDDGGLVRFFELNHGLMDSKWVADLSIVADGSLGTGSIVVGPDEARDTGKPLPQGFVESGAACTPQGYDQYYGSAWGADQGRADRMFLPIEFELEKAELNMGGHAARIHSGRVGDYSWNTVVENLKQTNTIPAAAFVAAMRPEIQAAAQQYGGAGPGNEFTPFEKRFLHCRMGFAGVVDDWMTKAAASSPNPGPFVQSWRGFISSELRYYVNKKAPPPAPGAAGFADFNPKPNWDEMVARTKQWLAEGKEAPPPAPVIAQAPAQQQPPPQPKIKKNVVPNAPDWSSELK